MAATVLILDESFALLANDDQRTLDGDALRFQQGLTGRYALLEQRSDPVVAYAIGGDFYHWIDGDQRLLGRLLESATRPLLFSLPCPGRTPSPVQWTLLQFSLQRPIAPPLPLDDFRLSLALRAAPSRAPQNSTMRTKRLIFSMPWAPRTSTCWSRRAGRPTRWASTWPRPGAAGATLVLSRPSRLASQSR